MPESALPPIDETYLLATIGELVIRDRRSAELLELERARVRELEAELDKRRRDAELVELERRQALAVDPDPPPGDA